MKASLMLMLISLAGCVSSKMVPLPDGSDGYMVRCTTEDRCLFEAAKVCERYDILRTTETGSAVPGVASEYKWLIKCAEGQAVTAR